MSEHGHIPDEDLLVTVDPTLRRVARLMTGRWEGVDELMVAITSEVARERARLDVEPEPAVRTLWRVAAAQLLTADRVPPQDYPPRRPGDSPAARLAPVLAALPSQKRLALVLAHGGNLTLDAMADAMGVTPTIAEGLLRAAEAQLTAIARSRGDEIVMRHDF